MPTERDERLSNELALLESIYPDQVRYQSERRELAYIAEDAGFSLRLPDEYLEDALPEVLSANASRLDIRDQLKEQVATCTVGEEILDSVILSFQDIVGSAISKSHTADHGNLQDHGGGAMDKKATVVVWLHHLLNTNKRKQALSPPSAAVSGVTKPGYPGVLIYSGPAEDVHEQVNDLKQLNWQAFQVRHESEEEWPFAHGAGVKEVEAMKDIVADLGEGWKDIFLEAMRMK